MSSARSALRAADILPNDDQVRDMPPELLLSIHPSSKILGDRRNILESQEILADRFKGAVKRTNLPAKSSSASSETTSASKSLAFDKGEDSVAGALATNKAQTTEIINRLGKKLISKIADLRLAPGHEPVLDVEAAVKVSDHEFDRATVVSVLIGTEVSALLSLTPFRQLQDTERSGLLFESGTDPPLV